MINSSHGKHTNRPTRLHKKCIVLLSVSLGVPNLDQFCCQGTLVNIWKQCEGTKETAHDEVFNVWKARMIVGTRETPLQRNIWSKLLRLGHVALSQQIGKKQEKDIIKTLMSQIFGQAVMAHSFHNYKSIKTNFQQMSTGSLGSDVSWSLLISNTSYIFFIMK